MKNTTIFLMILAAVLLIMGCDQKLELTGSSPLDPLEVVTTVSPDTIPVGYGAGLFAQVDGAVLPLKTVAWYYEGQFLSNASSVTFVPQKVGTYEFSFRVVDNAGRDTTATATLVAIPIDSAFIPPDTITLPPDTVVLPPDTVTIIERDTTFVYDTSYVYDTTVIIDTVTQHDSTVVYDTTVIIDTNFVHDTTHVVDTTVVYEIVTVYDTTYVVDTVFQNVYIVDTVYTDNLIYKTCRPWLIEYGNMSVTINLGNPHAGTFTLAAFRKRLTESLPEDLELRWDFGNGQIEYTSVHGEAELVESFWNVDLPYHATVTISFVLPQFAGKVSGTMCWEYFKGNWWWLSQPVTE